MVYFVYKLNVGVQLAQQIFANNEQEYLKKNLIVDTFNLLFEVEKINEYLFRVSLVKSMSDPDAFGLQWEELQNMTRNHFELYLKIFDFYSTEKRVVYPQEYLLLTEECGKLRRLFENKYPRLKESEFISDDFVENKYQIPVDYRVGTGITHLRKFFKLKEFIEKNSINYFTDSYLTFYYNSKTEHILIEGEDETSSLVIAKEIENYLGRNQNVKKHLGKVKLTPIYEEMRVESEEILEVEYSIVYPNPVSKEVDEALLSTLRESGGGVQKTKIKAEGKNFLDISKLFNNLQELAIVGYLDGLSIKAKGIKQSLVLRFKKIIYLEDDSDE